MRISDWSSDVCSSDLLELQQRAILGFRSEQITAFASEAALGIMDQNRVAVGIELIGGEEALDVGTFLALDRDIERLAHVIGIVDDRIVLTVVFKRGRNIERIGGFE